MLLSSSWGPWDHWVGSVWLSLAPLLEKLGFRGSRCTKTDLDARPSWTLSAEPKLPVTILPAFRTIAFNHETAPLTWEKNKGHSQNESYSTEKQEIKKKSSQITIVGERILREMSRWKKNNRKRSDDLFDWFGREITKQKKIWINTQLKKLGQTNRHCSYYIWNYLCTHCVSWTLF